MLNELWVDPSGPDPRATTASAERTRASELGVIRSVRAPVRTFAALLRRAPRGAPDHGDDRPVSKAGVVRRRRSPRHSVISGGLPHVPLPSSVLHKTQRAVQQRCPSPSRPSMFGGLLPEDLPLPTSVVRAVGLRDQARRVEHAMGRWSVFSGFPRGSIPLPTRILDTLEVNCG